jgi:hypothetical protein
MATDVAARQAKHNVMALHQMLWISIAAFDYLSWMLACMQAPPVAAARGLGLSLLNASGPVKTSIMKYAMGL